MARRLIVIGAGPIGIEAGLLGLELGLDVTVLERGGIGASLLAWGPTRFFSPVGMNVGPCGKRVLGDALPDATALLTGPEHVEKVLRPIVERSGLRTRLHTGCRVFSVGRARMIRGDMPRHPIRAERPFRVLYEDPNGVEIAIEADLVLDATGVSGTPTSIGAGGTPAIGERSARRAFIRQLGAIESRLPELKGRRMLLVGHGHSAANALGVLARAVELSPRTQVTWAVRSANTRPCTELATDPLPERKAVVARANGLAECPPAWLKVERRAQVEMTRETPDGIEVQLVGGRGGTFDFVLGFTGHRPDLSFLSELALDLSPISEGTLGIHRALACVTDCLSAPRLTAEDLASGEPGFSLVGAKSYGRMSNFLLSTGHEALEVILRQARG